MLNTFLTSSPLGKQAAPGKRDAPRPVAIGSSLGPGGQVIPFDPISGSNAPGKRTPVVALDPTTGRIIPRPETLPDGEPNLRYDLLIPRCETI